MAGRLAEGKHLAGSIIRPHDTLVARPKILEIGCGMRRYLAPAQRSKRVKIRNNAAG